MKQKLNWHLYATRSQAPAWEHTGSQAPDCASGEAGASKTSSSQAGAWERVGLLKEAPNSGEFDYDTISSIDA